MLRTLIMIWTCLFLFGTCSITTYEPKIEADEVNNQLLDIEQRAAIQADEMNLLSNEDRER